MERKELVSIIIPHLQCGKISETVSRDRCDSNLSSFGDYLGQ